MFDPSNLHDANGDVTVSGGSPANGTQEGGIDFGQMEFGNLDGQNGTPGPLGGANGGGGGVTWEQLRAWATQMQGES